jgi:hypothetical protein
MTMKERDVGGWSDNGGWSGWDILGRLEQRKPLRHIYVPTASLSLEVFFSCPPV